MCGIVAALAQRNVLPILLEGLRRLEYRGYDSAGVALITHKRDLKRVRVKGKVEALSRVLEDLNLEGFNGIAHTRWATHGQPSERNAHPHHSKNQISIVLNGIIENHAELKEQLQKEGYEFTSETDAEVIAHLIQKEATKLGSYIHGIKKAIKQLEGSYSIAVLNKEDPARLVGVRKGSPLVLGVGVEEYYLASDTHALVPVTQRFSYLEDGDIVDIHKDGYSIEDVKGNLVEREIKESDHSVEAASKGNYKHFMLKEIFEQPAAINNTLRTRIGKTGIVDGAIGLKEEILKQVKHIHFVACGTSYHAAYVARYWVERYAGIPCTVEVASEYRYREVQVPDGTLYVTLSQSGETADSLASLESTKDKNYLASLVICNVAESSMVRMADAALLTKAGPEIGVASTKAFTTQLVALWLLIMAVGKHNGLSEKDQTELAGALNALSDAVEKSFFLERQIHEMAVDFVEKHHTIFLGRGPFYPIALEAALKLKEISYIHSEGYPAGELKHGPLALVDSDVPVIAVAPNDGLLEKLKSNIEEVRARGGRLYIFADKNCGFKGDDDIKVINLPPCHEAIAPIVFTIPLQLLAYHVAVMRGTDVDQPRNLAKSVTVE